MKRKKGFTLIELLVVIAIIAILLAVLVPGLSRAKEYARNIVCRTNCRAFAVATHLYAEAYDQKLFSYEAGLYINLLSPFIGEADKVRYCPSTIIHKENPTATFWGNSREAWRWADGVPEPENGSYGLSGWCYSYPPGSATFVGTVERTEYPWPLYGNIKMPSLVPVFFDCSWVDAWPKHTDTVPADLNLDDPPHGADNPVNEHMRRLMLRRHFGICNIAFADSHTEPVELEKLWNLKWSQKFEPLGRDQTRVDGSAIYRRVN
ncbi:MAG TPA: type II secretion system protein [Anaerohalosphaeraceae bacterium]|jgi:prepilin-type N-terminal cleavage/methylation domain-containing protein|nr:type II secretion system protein [Anaerohalosphaeraceae bacterium]HRT50558.1 type II secretion system protein [Anaerohalosphaeraceae bacterium]HRT86502.1 type II secretion system protein [Anaerohalosphaeraceae bacterium]